MAKGMNHLPAMVRQSKRVGSAAATGRSARRSSQGEIESE
jgi:hypothetical protein